MSKGKCRKRLHEKFKRSKLGNDLKASDSSSLPPRPDKYIWNQMKDVFRTMDSNTKERVADAEHTYAEYKTSLGDLKSGLYAMSPLDRSRLPVLVVRQSCRMDPVCLQRVLKWSPSRKDINAFHIRNPNAFGLGETSFEVRLDHMDGEIIAIKLRNVFSMEQSLQSLQLQNCHDSISWGWNKGCEADPLPTSKAIKCQILNDKCMKSSGFAWTNVKKVIHLGPTSKSGVGCKYGYINSRGKKIYRSLSVHIDRHKWAKNGSKSISSIHNIDAKSGCMSIVDVAKNIYIDAIPGYLLSRGFERRDVQDCLSGINENMELSTLTLTKSKPIAIHRDPHTPTFALLFGHTTHDLINDEWIDPRVGGTLFLMDGLLELPYSPRDIVMLDGNFAHGVTTVQDHGKDISKRFSAILFCKWRREQLKKPGNYTGMNSQNDGDEDC